MYVQINLILVSTYLIHKYKIKVCDKNEFTDNKHINYDTSIGYKEKPFMSPNLETLGTILP
jgi:hypothetical protein